jgi:hypothetical protein
MITLPVEYIIDFIVQPTSPVIATVEDCGTVTDRDGVSRGELMERQQKQH